MPNIAPLDLNTDFSFAFYRAIEIRFRINVQKLSQNLLKTTTDHLLNIKSNRFNDHNSMTVIRLCRNLHKNLKSFENEFSILMQITAALPLDIVLQGIFL